MSKSSWHPLPLVLGANLRVRAWGIIRSSSTHRDSGLVQVPLHGQL